MSAIASYLSVGDKIVAIGLILFFQLTNVILSTILCLIPTFIS